METKKLACKELPTTAAQQKVRRTNSKEVYTIDETTKTVRLLLKNTEFGDIRTMTRCKDTDVFDPEVGMHVAKLKAIRRLAQLTKIRIRESIANKKEDIIHLNAMLRQQERTIKRMDKKIPLSGEPEPMIAAGVM